MQDSTFFLTNGCRADTNEFLSYTYIFRYSFYLKSLKKVCSCALLYLFLVIKKALFCSCKRNLRIKQHAEPYINYFFCLLTPVLFRFEQKEVSSRNVYILILKCTKRLLIPLDLHASHMYFKQKNSNSLSSLHLNVFQPLFISCFLRPTTEMFLEFNL